MKIYTFAVNYNSQNIYDFKIIERIHIVKEELPKTYMCEHDFQFDKIDIGRIFNSSYHDLNSEERSNIVINIFLKDEENFDKLKYKSMVLNEYCNVLTNYKENIEKTLKKIKSERSNKNE